MLPVVEDRDRDKDRVKGIPILDGRHPDENEGFNL
jgi:hypothetical protein